VPGATLGRFPGAGGRTPDSEGDEGRREVSATAATAVLVAEDGGLVEGPPLAVEKRLRDTFRGIDGPEDDAGGAEGVDGGPRMSAVPDSRP
jgi:hypothetical protein